MLLVIFKGINICQPKFIKETDYRINFRVKVWSKFTEKKHISNSLKCI